MQLSKSINETKNTLKKEPRHWPPKLNLSIAAIISIFAFIALHAYYITSDYKQLSIIQQKQQSLLTQYREAYDTKQNQITHDIASEAIPHEHAIEWLSDQINHAGLKLLEISPRAQIMQSKGNPTLAINIQATGTYHQFLKFLNQIIASHKAILIENLEIKKSPHGGLNIQIICGVY